MNNSAKFTKRLFAFFIDLTAVVIITWVLWLFPFQFIIGNSIQDDYKKVVEEKVTEISSWYEGQKDIFGASGTTDGYFPKLDNSKREGTITKEDYDEQGNFLGDDEVDWNRVRYDELWNGFSEWNPEIIDKIKNMFARLGFTTPREVCDCESVEDVQSAIERDILKNPKFINQLYKNLDSISSVEQLNKLTGWAVQPKQA